MPSVKCPNCGLVNFASEAKCKRCGAPLATLTEPGYQPLPQFQVAEDGYVFPPAPNLGYLWQKNGVLIFSKETLLPERCVKCNVPTGGSGVKRKLSWHHPILYLLIFGAALLYIVLAMVLSKRAKVFIGLCADHRLKRRNGMIGGWLLFLGGFIGAILSIANDYTVAMIICLLLIPVGLVWLIIAARVVTVKKIDDRFVWLKGINRDYLAAFPPYPW